MLTSQTWSRRSLFNNDQWARLFLETLYHYKGLAYLLHEFVLMPDHFHLLITPTGTLEKAAQFVKGGFSFRAKKELGSNLEVWQPGFQDQRIRDAADFAIHVKYIQENPVRAHLAEQASQYPSSSAYPGFELDPCPPGLKPQILSGRFGAAEAAPLQDRIGPQQNKGSTEIRDVAEKKRSA